MVRLRSARRTFIRSVLLGAAFMVLGSAVPVGATTATYAGCDVTAPKPSIARLEDGDFIRATGSISCNERKTLTILVKLVWKRVGNPWEVVDRASDSGKGVFGLYGSVSDACGHQTSASWKDVVTVTINGDKKPAVESEITEC